MLTPLKEEDFNKYIDFAYALALDPTKSGYPTYADGVKTKGDFITRSLKAFERAGEQILLYEREGKVAGWIHYYYLPEDKYLDTCSFCVAEGMSDAIREFIVFAREHYSGSRLYLGFPGENAEAVSTLRAEGFSCIERSCNDIFDLPQWEERPNEPGIVPVTRENFPLFRALHTQDEDMYRNSDRLLADLDDWRLLLYLRDGVPAGAIQAMRDADMGEVFGIFFPEDFNAATFQALMKAALNGAKHDGAGTMVFFSDGREHEAALALGFRCVGEYVCYCATL